MMRTIVCAALVCAALPALADEIVVPSTPPVVTEDVVTGYHVESVFLGTPLGRSEEAVINILITPVRGDGGCARDTRGECRSILGHYSGATAVTLLNQLNTLDFTTNSFRKRLLQRLQTDGILGAGNISGAPGVPTPVPTPTP